MKNPHELMVSIEVPRWSFRKRGSTGIVDFVAPFPCLYNYGSVPDLIGMDNDLLDAVVIGRRLRAGACVQTLLVGVIGLTDRDMYDDKLICSDRPLTPWQRTMVLGFFHCYALFKRVLNWQRGRSGVTRCEGWGDANAALARARHRTGDWSGPTIAY